MHTHCFQAEFNLHNVALAANRNSEGSKPQSGELHVRNMPETNHYKINHASNEPKAGSWIRG